MIVIAEAEAVALLSKRVKEINIQTRSRVNKESWPPGQPKIFAPLILIQHQGYRNLKQSIAMAKFVGQGGIDKVVSTASSDAVPKPPKYPKL